MLQDDSRAALEELLGSLINKPIREAHSEHVAPALTKIDQNLRRGTEETTDEVRTLARRISELEESISRLESESSSRHAEMMQNVLSGIAALNQRLEAILCQMSEAKEQHNHTLVRIDKQADAWLQDCERLASDGAAALAAAKGDISEQQEAIRSSLLEKLAGLENRLKKGWWLLIFVSFVASITAGVSLFALLLLHMAA